MSDVYHFSRDALEALLFAHDEAEFRNHVFLNSVHVLLGLLRHASVHGEDVLNETGLLLAPARAVADRTFPPQPHVTVMGDLHPTLDADRLLARAVSADEARSRLITVRHLWHAILNDEASPALQVIRDSGADVQRLRTNCRLWIPFEEILAPLERPSLPEQGS